MSDNTVLKSEQTPFDLIDLDCDITTFLSRLAPCLQFHNIGVIIVNLDLNVLFVNDAIQELTQSKIDYQETPTTIQQLFPSLRGLNSIVEKCIHTINSQVLDKAISISTLGDQLPIRIHIRPLVQSPDNKAIGAYITVEPDTFRLIDHLKQEKTLLADRIKDLTREVYDKTNLVRGLFDKNPFGIAIIDNKRRIISVNSTAGRILGAQQNSLIGQSCEKIFNCYQCNNTCPVMDQNLELKEVETKTAGSENPDATLLRSAVVTYDKAEQFLIETFIDVTDLKEKEAMRALLKARNDFFASTSHELRTPLNAIIGYAEMVEDAIDDLSGLNSEEKQDKFITPLRTISESGWYLRHLIDQVLDLAKIEAGKLEINLRATDLREHIHYIEKLAVPLARKNNNVFSLSIESNLSSIHTDALRLNQILLNLISNACKFTDNGLVKFTIDSDIMATNSKWIVFSVSDTGKGMTEEQLKRVFHRYEQAESNTAERYGGTGLGLPITKELCELMGGDIKVYSAPGQGSTFKVSFPAIQTILN